MVSMTGCTGGCAHIAADHEIFMVNAGVVLRELVRRYSIWLHVRGIRMAMGAGCRHIDGIDARPRIAGRP